MSVRTRTRSRRAPAVAGLAVAALILTGCGGADTSDDTAASSAPAAEETTSSAPAEEPAEGSEGGSEGTEDESGQGGTLAVSSVDFAFEMEEDSFSPGTYEITLTNEGSASHDLVVERDGEDVAASDVIGPGETSTFEVTLEEGEYVFYCSVGNHRGMGMEVPVEVSA